MVSALRAQWGQQQELERPGSERPACSTSWRPSCSSVPLLLHKGIRRFLSRGGQFCALFQADLRTEMTSSVCLLARSVAAGPASSLLSRSFGQPVSLSATEH